MHESEKWKWSRTVVSDSSQPQGLQPTRLLCLWDFPGKSTGVGKITVGVEYLYSSHKGNYEIKCTDVQKSVLQLKPCSPGTALDQWRSCPDHISRLMPGHWLHFHFHSLGLWCMCFIQTLSGGNATFSDVGTKFQHNCLWKTFSALRLQLSISLI